MLKLRMFGVTLIVIIMPILANSASLTVTDAKDKEKIGRVILDGNEIKNVGTVRLNETKSTLEVMSYGKEDRGVSISPNVLSAVGVSMGDAIQILSNKNGYLICFIDSSKDLINCESIHIGIRFK